MTEMNKYPGQIVFGLDIGTRSIVGTVGYKEEDIFHVVAQRTVEHETRAMLDGQIHDIARVGQTIARVKEELEKAVGRKLTDVCIAAAGRVLRTVNVHVENEFEGEKEILAEDIYALDSTGVEKAYEEFAAQNTETEMNFYCVGYSVIRYYMNDYPIGNLENHKARRISADLIATFLPDDVVDGLYKAVEYAGLRVVNLTLEPIAAIQVAIPEMYRMLNIALVDVGAGTSDISITKDGAIIAYGMIPMAGDGLTELIAQHCLVDFVTAEEIKRQACEKDAISYQDIMGLQQTITAEEITRVTAPALSEMTRQVSDKIKELNGDKAVSAVFVVGGGGKLPGYTQSLAAELDIPKERVALRGEEVMGKIDFWEQDSKKDSLLVTPIGICLTFYMQSNNFIFVSFNAERVKLYDNARLAVVDAAMQAGFPNDGLFPKRGRALNFTVNGKQRIIRGEPGEAAVITLNGEIADMYVPIKANDVITVRESTAGPEAKAEVQQLTEYHTALHVKVNGVPVKLPRFVKVNGRIETGYYEIQEQDAIEILDYYTVEQLLQYMDIAVEEDAIYVNRTHADLQTQIYENFRVEWNIEPIEFADHAGKEEETEPESKAGIESEMEPEMEPGMEQEPAEDSRENAGPSGAGIQKETGNGTESTANKGIPMSIQVTVNKQPVRLSGKTSYVFVDIFDHYPFDLSNPQGRSVVTVLNGRPAQYLEPIHSGDTIEIYWKK